MSETAPSVTRDGFLNGAVTVLQPAYGYRAGLDAVMLAASLTTERGQSLAEAGAGAGVALFCAAHRLPSASFTGFEREQGLVFLAAESAALNGVSQRVRVEAGDVARRPPDLENLFDQSFSNPPFFEPGHVRPPGAGKVGSYLALTPLREWLLFLLHITRPKGSLTLIHRAAALADILAELQSRAGEIEVMPIRPAPGAPAHRVLVRCRKGLRRGPLTLYDGIDLHAYASGPVTGRAAEALAGAELEWR
jgi:tRNA1(Val) A37 N6-methylase TrmN6